MNLDPAGVPTEHLLRTALGVRAARKLVGVTLRHTGPEQIRRSERSTFSQGTMTAPRYADLVAGALQDAVRRALGPRRC